MKTTKSFTQEEIKEIRSRINVSVESTGKFIREARTQHHLSQSSLGSVLYVTKKAVSKWERGLGYPSMDVLPYLAETLGVTTDEIIYAKFDNENKYEDSNKTLKLIYKIFKNKHVKLIIKSCVAIVFICLCIFYFENHNAVKIYALWSEDNYIHLENAILTTTPINEYLNIGYLYVDIPDIDDNSQINYTLYIGDENNVERIVQEYMTKDFIPHLNNLNSDENPKIKLKDNFDKLYLNINYINTDGETKDYVIKIKVALKYQSNDIINIFRNNENKLLTNNNLLRLNEPTASEIDSDLSIDLSFLYDLNEEERRTKIKSYDGKYIEINGKKEKITIINYSIYIDTKEVNVYFDFNKKRILFKNANKIKINIDKSNARFKSEQKELYLIISKIVEQLRAL